jgi:hypothetical protein
LTRPTAVTQAAFLRAKQNVTVAIELLNWLHDHAITFDVLDQGHVEAWQPTGPSTCGHASESALPAPLDEPLRELAADRGGSRTAAHLTPPGSSADTSQGSARLLPQNH